MCGQRRAATNVFPAFTKFIGAEGRCAEVGLSHVVRGNVGRLIAEEFANFVETDQRALIHFAEVFAGDSLPVLLAEKVRQESHTRLYLATKNILKILSEQFQQEQDDTNAKLDRLIDFCSCTRLTCKLAS